MSRAVGNSSDSSQVPEPNEAAGGCLISGDRLLDLVRQVFIAAGADEEAASLVARSLILSNLRGVDSHGFIRVSEYLKRIRGGRIDPTARPTVERKDAALVQVDGHRCFGQLGARFATLQALSQARKNGLALATLKNVVHVGRLGEYVELAAEQGFIALACCNGGPPGGNVAPFGGRSRALATNPIAYAIPAGEGPAIAADFSTAISAEGKIRVALQAGKPLPEPWIVDIEGNLSRDPHDLYAGGAILPMAGHKGFALALLVEILGGVLVGEGCACLGEDPGNGFLILALDVARFRSLESFGARVDEVIEAMHAVPPASGFDRVLVPGEPELAVQQRREREGIPVSAGTWRQFEEAARSVGVEIEEGTCTWAS
jgi:uncharacterized oxidoreductase